MPCAQPDRAWHRDIHYPEIPLSTIIERATNHMPPFKEEGDRGLKDTMIWLTLLEHANKHHRDTVILITADGDLSRNIEAMKKEFHARSQKGLHVFKTILEAKNFIDKSRKLGLGLSEREQIILKRFKGSAGQTLIGKVNHTQHPTAPPDLFNQYNGRIVGLYDPVSFEIIDFHDSETPNEYYVKIKAVVESYFVNIDTGQEVARFPYPEPIIVSATINVVSGSVYYARMWENE